MTNVIQEPHLTEQQPHPFGVRLQSARETLGMDRKDAAAHLRVHEKIIIMMESGIFNNDLPLTFIRGYIRSYSKLLEIPDQEIIAALDLIKPKPEAEETSPLSLNPKSSSPRTAPISSDSQTIFMTLFTSLILVTLIGLVAVWWHSHKTTGMSPPFLPTENISPFHQPSPATAAGPSHLTATAVYAGIEEIIFPSYLIESRANTAETVKVDMPPGQTENVNLLSEEKAPHSASMKEPSPPSLSSGKPFIDLSFIAHSLTSIKNKFAPYFNQGNRLALEKAIRGDKGLQLLLEFILFLFIINVGLRKYYNRSLTYVMAGARSPIRTTPKPFRPLMLEKHPKRKWTKAFLSILILGVFIFMGSKYWQKHAITPVTVKSSPSPAAVATQARPDLDLQIYANLESLAPSSNLNAEMRKAFKIYPLQSILDQLNSFITQAAVIQFALTDPSTDLGQLPPVNKKTRHRRKHVVTTYNENIDPYNDT